MSCPPEIAEVIAGIIQAGLLRIRQAGWAGDGRRCAVEADHIHNLPQLLTNFSPELLKFYWEVERHAFLDRCDGQKPADFENLWARLAPWASDAKPAASPS